jgi:dTDP-4-dehydrorhamnose reductase
MKFLITGASGQLGREWVGYLKKRELPFVAFSSRELDITNAGDVRTVINREKPDVVINCAAYTNVDKAEKEPDLAFLVNEAGVSHLAESCREAGSILVHYSTDYVFPGHSNDEQTYPDGYPEEASTGPVNVYGESKRAGEVVLENSPADWLLIRVSWLCGQYGNNFVKTMLRLAENRDQLDVVDDQTGSPTFAFDLVEKTHQLLQKKIFGTFHLSCSGAVTWAGFAEEIFHQTKAGVTVNRISSDQFKRDAKRPDFSLLSTRKAEQAGLNIIDWKTGLSKLLQQTGR